FEGNVHVPELDRLAIEGGEPLPTTAPHRFYLASDEASVRAALDAIASTVYEEFPMLCDESCYARGCPSGQICSAGACRPDPCASSSCGSSQYCVDGACRRECVDGCGSHEVCRDGECVADPCAALGCANCVNGACPGDACRNDAGTLRACGAGRACTDGECR